MDKAEHEMKDEDKLELLRWLIERSDSFRASYSNRAALIVTADALVIATVAFLLDKVQLNHPYRVYIIWWIYLSLAAMYLSLILGSVYISG